MSDWREICTVSTDQGPATLSMRVDDAEHGGVVDLELRWPCGDADIVQGFTMNPEEVRALWEAVQELIEVGGKEVEGETPDLKPCPFCGSTDIEERYLDDDCDEIEEWMMEEANSYVEEDGGEPYNSIDEYREDNAYYWQVYCPRCDVYVTSGLSMKDAWAKWNRRAEE